MPINNDRRVKQIIRFDGIEFGNNKCPMDIDAFVEFDETFFIFYEFKLRGAPMSLGQRIGYQHITDALIEAGKYAVTLVCDHETFDCDEDVIAKDATVREAYFGKKWIEMKTHPNILTATNMIIKYWRGMEGGDNN